MDTKKSCKWVGGPNKGILLLPWLIYVIRWYVCYWKVWESCCCFSDCCCCCVCLQVCVLRLWPVSVIRWLMHYTDTGGWPLSQVTHVCSGALHWANWGPGLSSCETWWPSVHSGLCTGNTHMYTRGLHYNLYFTTTRRAHRITEIKFIV